MRMTSPIPLPLLLIAVVCSWPSFGARQAGAEEPPPAVTIPRSEHHVLHSAKVDDDLSVMVALPFSYANGERSYPVVYALDADMGFGGLVEILRMGVIGQEIPEVILVAQGYPNPSVDRVMTLRSRDYTPIESAPPVPVLDAEGKTVPPPPTGGAPRFLAFLADELIPWVEQRYRTNDTRVFVGDSYGGLFGLYALFHEPETFDGYLIGSPSIWFGDGISLDYEEAWAKDQDDLEARVFFSVGFLEEIPGVEPLDSFRMVSNTRLLHHRLTERAYPSLELELVLFDEETHISVVPAAMSRGLRWLLPTTPPDP